MTFLFWKEQSINMAVVMAIASIFSFKYNLVMFFNVEHGFM